MGQAEPDSSTGVANVAQPTDCGCNSDSDADADADADSDCDCLVTATATAMGDALICNAAVVAMHKSLSYLWHDENLQRNSAARDWQLANG